MKLYNFDLGKKQLLSKSFGLVLKVMKSVLGRTGCVIHGQHHLKRYNTSVRTYLNGSLCNFYAANNELSLAFDMADVFLFGRLMVLNFSDPLSDLTTF